MDPEVSVLLHCAEWRGLLVSQVHVEISERFNRKTETALECQIEEVWADRTSKEPWLFNGAKFRLHSFTLTSPEYPHSATSPDLLQRPCMDAAGDTEGKIKRTLGDVKDLPITDLSISTLPVCFEGKHYADSEKKENILLKPSQTFGKCAVGGTNAVDHCPDKDIAIRELSPVLTLKLGLTCYKDFLGTNWSGRAEELRKRGEVDFEDPLALLAQPLGVGGILCTSDGQVVLIRRSQRVAEAQGLLDIPGGHPEPKAVCEGLGQGVCEEQISVAMLQQVEQAVVKELFSSVCAEIRDEVNVPLSSLGEPLLMGIALNHTSAGRPSAEFYISCSLSAADVQKLYWNGGAEAHESTDVVFLSRTEILRLDKSTPLWSELCPSAKGAVLLYQLVKPDREVNGTSWSDTDVSTAQVST
ncbi:uridine diphosphate glucose pyrophosphatase NUDT22 [Aplochiton taeniatus]